MKILLFQIISLLVVIVGLLYMSSGQIAEGTLLMILSRVCQIEVTVSAAGGKKE